MLKKYISPSLEAIDSQGKSMLFKELTLEFDTILQNKDFSKKGVQKNLKRMEEIIKKSVGIEVYLVMDEDTLPNAYVIPPDIDSSNPILTDFHKAITKSDAGLKLIKSTGGVLHASVNRQTSKVSGAFTKFPVNIHFSKGLLTYPSLDMSAGELAAIIIHEIGHVFTYMEYLGTGITTNYVLQHTSRTLLETREIKRRYEIVKETEKLLDIEVQDIDALTKTDNETVIQTVLLREVAVKRMSELDSNTYDLTAWEMLSDQFAARHGAGKDITMALAKMHKLFGDSAFQNQGEFMFTQVITGVLALLTTIMTAGVFAILLFFVLDPTIGLYDKLEARLTRVKRDLISQLKEGTANKEYKDVLVKDIADIDDLLSTMKDRQNFIELWWVTVMPKSRRNYKQLVFQQELEAMVNNDLFTASHKLKNV